MAEDFLYKKINERKTLNAFRALKLPGNRVDFYSNDYLGIIKNDLLQPFLTNGLKHGSGGSRLLAGNYSLIEETEKAIADFHDAEEGLIFNSGYDANVGLLSCVPQKGDTILYDKLSHASIRDGIRLSFAESLSFLHNDVEDLEKKLKVSKGNIFVVTESVFSMDGDTAPLVEIVALCEKYNANLIVDEAHATGIIGEKGEGLVQLLDLQKKCFARVHTFGKACGVHGAIVLGSNALKYYLINFARAFIFTTALPEASMNAIQASYQIFPALGKERKYLNELIDQFQKSKVKSQRSKTPIQVVIIPGNKEAKAKAEELQQHNLDVRAILYPTVPKGSERLRIVLHSFNTVSEVNQLINILQE
ncbi:MAG: 8-amino-7-oxononanoate synthase [Ginsengibacter sp.]